MTHRVTTVTVYLEGTHPALDTSAFNQRLRELLAEHVGVVGQGALIAVDESDLP